MAQAQRCAELPFPRHMDIHLPGAPSIGLQICTFNVVLHVLTHTYSGSYSLFAHFLKCKKELKEGVCGKRLSAFTFLLSR